MSSLYEEEEEEEEKERRKKKRAKGRMLFDGTAFGRDFAAKFSGRKFFV